MTNKEKRDRIKAQCRQLIDENKRLLIVASSVLLITMITLLNIHLFQMSYYTMQKDKTQVIKLLNKDVQKTFRQDDWYFKTGIQYLLHELEDESKDFLEQNFKYFVPEMQQKIISAYNDAKIGFKQNIDVFHAIINAEDTSIYSMYMKNLTIEEIEKGLKGYFGEQPKLTQATVEQIYKIISMQQEKLTLNTFKLNVYELMSFPHNGDVNSASLKMLDCIQAEAAKKSLFTELKTVPIEMELFGVWVEILNKKKIITTTEYAAFTTAYGNIKRIQDQYKQVLLQEVDLMNIKQMIDVQTEEKFAEIEKLKKEIQTLDASIQKDNEQLQSLKNYRVMEFYVLDQYENGEYEVAIPEKSWLFGTYKPSSERIRLKVTSSTIQQQGVMSFEVHPNGKSADGLPYYVEVSPSEKEEIAQIEAKIKEAQDGAVAKQERIQTINEEIDQIRKASNYDQTVTLIEEITNKKANLEIDIKKEKLVIQNLFQIGDLVVELKK